MIRHLPHHAIDKAQWDAWLLQCPDRLWYMQSWVLDLCCPEWEALVDDAGAIMPLIHRRKYGFDYLYQPYARQQQGVFAPAHPDGLDDAFLAAVPWRFRYWDIQLNTAMRVRAERGDRLEPRTNQEMRLDADATTLRAAYSQGHRRNLKKAGGDPPVIVRDVGSAEFTALFERTTGKRFGNVPPDGMRLLERLVAGALERGQCDLLGVREKDALIAAVCFMKWEGRSILLKSANDKAGSQRQAMFHLIDRYIGEHAGSGLLLDFAGSNTPSVARFNAGFGARSSVYLRLVRNRLPLPFRWLKR
jgi:hypothetical protein